MKPISLLGEERKNRRELLRTCSGIATLFTGISSIGKTALGQEFHYDLESLRKTDPDLILYDETETRIDTGLKEARAIAVSTSDSIYVTGGKAIRAFDPVGKKLHIDIELERELTAITVADDGSLYVGVGDHVEHYDSSGRLKKRWESAGPKALLTSIGVFKEHVFVADRKSREIIHYDTSGRKIDSFGDFVIPSPGFGLTISPDGLLWVANTGKHRVEAYAFNGNLVSWWGSFSNYNIKGFCGCCNPMNLTVLPDSEGFVTSEKGLTRIKVYDREGEFVGVVAGPESFTRHDSLTIAPDYDCSRIGLDIAVDSKGRVLVLDPALAEVRIFNRKVA